MARGPANDQSSTREPDIHLLGHFPFLRMAALGAEVLRFERPGVNISPATQTGELIRNHAAVEVDLRSPENLKRASETYGVDTRQINPEVGRKGLVGGREGMITDVALDFQFLSISGAALLGLRRS